MLVELLRKAETQGALGCPAMGLKCLDCSLSLLGMAVGACVLHHHAEGEEEILTAEQIGLAVRADVLHSVAVTLVEAHDAAEGRAKLRRGLLGHSCDHNMCGA